MASRQGVVGSQTAVAAVHQARAVDRHQIGGGHIFRIEAGGAGGRHGFSAHKPSSKDAQCRRGAGGAVIGFTGCGHAGRQALRRDAGRHGFAGGVNRIVTHHTAFVASDIAQHQTVHRDLIGADHILAVVGRAGVAQTG